MNKYIIFAAVSSSLTIGSSALADQDTVGSLMADPPTTNVPATAPVTNTYVAPTTTPMVAPNAHAATTTHQVDEHPWHVGGEFSLGFPSGASLGVVVNPKLDWVQLGAYLDYNYVAPFGGKLSLKLDPLALLPDVPIGIFGDLQAGIFPEGKIPGHSDVPGVGYSFESFLGGLRLGKATGFRWNFEFGESHLNVHTSNFQSVVSSNNASGTVIFGNPHASGWVPGFSTGFELLF